MSTDKPMISLQGVRKAYQTPAGELPALKGIDLQVRAGEFIGIIGRSGAGKTTLVNMISGTDALSAGEVWVDGDAVHLMEESTLALWRGLKVGIIYQSFQLLPNLSLLDNILLPMDFCGLYRAQASQQRALELLRLVELETHAGKLPSAISGGQQQRVAIARALANDPALILADEPTGRLDSQTAATIFELFEELIRQGKTILMVTHDPSLTGRFSRVLALADGLITADTAATARGGSGDLA